MGSTTSPRRWTVTVALVMGLLLAPAAVAQAAPHDPATACRNGAWRTLVDLEGRSFPNLGRCVAAAAKGDLGQPLDPQVTGPVTGTTVWEMYGVCRFIFQELDLTYSTESGDGSLSIEGCVAFPTDFILYDYSGSFTLTSPSGGTLTGSVDGTIDGVSGDLDLTLVAETATGSLDGATGTVQLTGVWDTTGSTVSGGLSGQLSRG